MLLHHIYFVNGLHLIMIKKIHLKKKISCRKKYQALSNENNCHSTECTAKNPKSGFIAFYFRMKKLTIVYNPQNKKRLKQS